jgi:hypothetical protein
MGVRAVRGAIHWRILHKLRCSPHYGGRLAKAIHVHRTTKPPPDEKPHCRTLLDRRFDQIPS